MIRLTQMFWREPCHLRAHMDTEEVPQEEIFTFEGIRVDDVLVCQRDAEKAFVHIRRNTLKRVLAKIKKGRRPEDVIEEELARLERS